MIAALESSQNETSLGRRLTSWRASFPRALSSLDGDRPWWRLMLTDLDSCYAACRTLHYLLSHQPPTLIYVDVIASDAALSEMNGTPSHTSRNDLNCRRQNEQQWWTAYCYEWRDVHGFNLSRSRDYQSTNQSKQICIAPCVSSESEALLHLRSSIVVILMHYINVYLYSWLPECRSHKS